MWAQRTAGWVCGLVVSWVGLTGCGGAEPAAAPPAEPPVTTMTTPPVTTPPVNTTTVAMPPDTELEGVCDGESFPNGAAYTGPPPHPTQAHGFGTMYGEYDQWPAPWPDWAPGTADAADIQLVLCEELLDEEPTDLVCRYKPEFAESGGPRSLTVTLQVARLRLYEVRTGKLVTESVLTGPRECPEVAVTGADEDTVTSFLDVPAYAEAMRAFVME